MLSIIENECFIPLIAFISAPSIFILKKSICSILYFSTDSSTVIYADFGQRFVAWIIDFIIVAVISIILFSIGEWFFAIIIGYVLALLYFWLLEAFNNGQTIGKMAMKLRTVNEKTLEVAEPVDYLINNILKSNLGLLIIDVIVGLISNSDDPKNRIRIMQGASNTVVIKTE